MLPTTSTARSHRDLHSFPTRRSSDLAPLAQRAQARLQRRLLVPHDAHVQARALSLPQDGLEQLERRRVGVVVRRQARSEEHTSELQSRLHLVCRLLLEKKKKQ